MTAAEEAIRLILELQTIARDAGHPVPLLIALDQENGGVNSLYDEFYIRQFPSAMGIAATGSQSLAHEVALATAQEMKAVGVNWLLGPVLDVLTNVKSQPLGVRTMGDDPVEVSRYGVEFMKGFQEAGLATCGKHFPSYGNLEFLNAHTDANASDADASAAESPDQADMSALAPFRNTIAQGLDAMMVGGVPMSSTGANVMHGSLSEHVVHRLLRECLDFQGVVVSECLEMEALTHSMGISGGTVMAKNAGCDIILLCRSFTEQQEAINGLRFGIESGIIGRAQVEQSLRRVLRMKTRCTSWEQALNPPGLQALAQMQLPHASLSQKAYHSSISVVRDKRNLLPLTSILDPSDEILLLTPLVKPLPTSAVSRAVFPQLDLVSSFEDPIGWDRTMTILSGESVFKEFGRSLARQRHGRVLHTSYTANGVRPIHEHLIDRASAVIVVTTDATRHLYQQSFTKHVSMLCRRSPNKNDKYSEDEDDEEDEEDEEDEDEDEAARDKPLVVVAASSPYDFTTDGSIETYICTYDFTEAALETVVQVLYGKLNPMGTLPGSVRRSPKLHQARQHWLVEAWNEERDGHALEALLDTIRIVGTSAQSLQLMGVTANSFLLRRPETVMEGHLVVRSSNSDEIYGFCTTYFFQSTGTGVIGSLIVDPARQNLSIGSTLHHRAIRTLLQRKGLQRLQLGCCFPAIYLGIPANHPAERKRLRQWFANRGWKTGHSRPVHSMLLRDLPVWVPPESIVTHLLQSSSTSSNSSSIRYELLFGWDHAETVLNYVKRTTTTATKKPPSRLGLGTQDLDLYTVALRDAPNCGIIRAVRVDDRVVVGSVIVYNSQSVLASHSQPFLQTRQQLIHAGGLAALITTSPGTNTTSNTGTTNTTTTTTTTTATTTDSIAQGLVLLGTKQLRKQGAEAVVLDSVSNNTSSLSFPFHFPPPVHLSPMGTRTKKEKRISKAQEEFQINIQDPSIHYRSTTASSSACPQWASARRIGPKRSMGC